MRVFCAVGERAAYDFRWSDELHHRPILHGEHTKARVCDFPVMVVDDALFARSRVRAFARSRVARFYLALVYPARSKRADERGNKAHARLIPWWPPRAHRARTREPTGLPGRGHEPRSRARRPRRSVRDRARKDGRTKGTQSRPSFDPPHRLDAATSEGGATPCALRLPVRLEATTKAKPQRQLRRTAIPFGAARCLRTPLPPDGERPRGELARIAGAGGSVSRDGIEPPTRGFSVLCSTN